MRAVGAAVAATLTALAPLAVVGALATGALWRRALFLATGAPAARAQVLGEPTPADAAADIEIPDLSPILTPPSAAPSAGQSPAESLRVAETAAHLIEAHHLKRDRLRGGLPTHSVGAIIAALRVGPNPVDPYAAWAPPRSPSAAPVDPLRPNDLHGYGVMLIQERNGDFYAAPTRDGPLWRAGMRDGLRIIAIDDLRAMSMTGETLARYLAARAAHDAPVLFTFSRAARGDDLLVTLRASPAWFDAPTVDVVETATGPVVRIFAFEESVTDAALAAAIARLPAQGPVVLDLRYVIGGDVAIAVNALSRFIAPGLEVHVQVDADGAPDRWFSVAPEGATARGRDLALLIGPGTVSAGEIFVRALARWGGALTVGRRTYGKCRVQSVYPLPDGSSLIFTTARTLDAAGVDCEGVGVSPDIEISDSRYRDLSAMASMARAALRARPPAAAPAAPAAPARAAAAGTGAPAADVAIPVIGAGNAGDAGDAGDGDGVSAGMDPAFADVVTPSDDLPPANAPLVPEVPDASGAEGPDKDARGPDAPRAAVPSSLTPSTRSHPADAAAMARLACAAGAYDSASAARAAALTLASAADIPVDRLRLVQIHGAPGVRLCVSAASEEEASALSERLSRDMPEAFAPWRRP